ncbi:hypothetical protein EJB05_13286, partial [Eragrostis curvula]
MAPRYTPIFFFLFVFALAVAPAPSSAALAEAETCVPSLQRMLSCLDFIEHRTDEIPVPCCIQVNSTVAQQPCCLMHVMHGHVAKLIGPEYDNRRAMVDVTAKCLGNASALVSIRRNCSGKPLPPLTPEFTFTTEVPQSSSGATRLLGSSYPALLLAFLACFVVLRSS